MKCPRCSSSSIVDRFDPVSDSFSPSGATPLTTRSKSTSLFRNQVGQLSARTPRLGMIAKHQSCPIPFRTPTSVDWSSTEDDSGMFGMSLDSHLMTPSQNGDRSTSPVECGQCTNSQCGFRFCVNCWTDFHGSRQCYSNIGKICTDDMHSSRSSDVACSKQSKRNLKRLIALDP